MQCLKNTLFAKLFFRWLCGVFQRYGRGGEGRVQVTRQFCKNAALSVVAFVKTAALCRHEAHLVEFGSVWGWGVL